MSRVRPPHGPPEFSHKKRRLVYYPAFYSLSTATRSAILSKGCPSGRRRFAELVSLRESTGSSLTLFGCVLILPLCLSVVHSRLAIMTLPYAVGHGRSLLVQGGFSCFSGTPHREGIVGGVLVTVGVCSGSAFRHIILMLWQRLSCTTSVASTDYWNDCRQNHTYAVRNSNARPNHSSPPSDASSVYLRLRRCIFHCAPIRPIR